MSDTDSSVQSTQSIQSMEPTQQAGGRKRRGSGPDTQSPRKSKRQATSQDLTASQDEAKKTQKKVEKQARAMITIGELTRTTERVILTKKELIEALARRTKQIYAVVIVNYVETLKADHKKAISKLRQDLAKAKSENARLIAEISEEQTTDKNRQKGTRKTKNQGEPESQTESGSQMDIIAIPDTAQVQQRRKNGRTPKPLGPPRISRNRRIRPRTRQQGRYPDHWIRAEKSFHRCAPVERRWWREPKLGSLPE